MTHRYIFFDIRSAIRGLSDNDIKDHKRAFTSAIEKNADVRPRAYATLGFKPNTSLK